MRTFYTDYVQHCMKFYVHYSKPKFRNDVDKRNWKACESAIKSFDNHEQEILMTIYRDGDTIPDCIYKISTELGINQDTVWKLVTELERKIAKRRELI